MEGVERALRDLGLTRDTAQYICEMLHAMYLAEWRGRMAEVHDTLDVAMYCVKSSIEEIKRSGTPPIVGSRWTGYSLVRYQLRDGTLRGLEVHALERSPGHPEDDMCVECGEFPNSIWSEEED